LLADRFFLGCAIVFADFLREDLLHRERALAAFQPRSCSRAMAELKVDRLVARCCWMPR
jgi:hypothetical protein